MLVGYPYLVLDASGPVAGLTPVVIATRTFPGNVGITPPAVVTALTGGMYQIMYDPEAAGDIAVLVDNGVTIPVLTQRYQMITCTLDRSKIESAIDSFGKVHARYCDDKDGYGISPTGLNAVTIEGKPLPLFLLYVGAAAVGNCTLPDATTVNYAALGAPATPRITAVTTLGGGRAVTLH